MSIALDFALVATLVVFSLEANLSLYLHSADWLLAIALALPPALLWSYDDSFWVYGDLPWQRHQSQTSAAVGSFQPIARNLALFYLAVLFYISSFYWFWHSLSQPSLVEQSTRFNWVPLLDILILSGLALFEWWHLALQAKKPSSAQRENLTTIVIGIFIAIAALTTFWHTSITAISVFATFIFNVLLFLLAAGLIREGLAQGKRRAFWGGMVLLTLRILSWFVLSATGLLFKSLVFMLCGVGVIAVGLWFERYVRTLSHTPSRRGQQM